MTPEQLEAHRVRFEQQSGEPETMKGQRRGDGYANHSDTRTWQAYQCGIADADRAQRAAPGVQGGEPTPWRNEMMDMAIAAGVAPNTIFHFEAAFLRFAESLEKKINTAQPPQQSAQPGGEAVKLVDALLLEAEIFWWNDGPEGKSSDAMKAARDQVIVALSAAAQPVEVQQVRDAIDVYHAELDDRLHAGHSMGRAIDAIEQALGMPWIQGASLKPTSSEGGA